MPFRLREQSIRAKFLPESWRQGTAECGFVFEMGDTCCQDKVTSLPPASLAPVAMDRKRTWPPILRSRSLTDVSGLSNRRGLTAVFGRAKLIPNQMRQLALRLPRRGGKRPGAGRKPNGRRPLVSHRSRPKFENPAAVQVTLRVAGHVWNLRSRRCFETIEDCLAQARERFGLRVIEFTVLGNHLHLIVEADDDEALSRGMQGLDIRIARALNRLMEKRGRVFADHYHSRLLRSPTELVNAIAYVLGNAAHHYGESGQDRFSSGAYESPRRNRILSHPRTWLLRSGWRRARTVPQWLAANAWPPPWTREHRPNAPPQRSDR